MPLKDKNIFMLNSIEFIRESVIVLQQYSDYIRN